MHWNKGDILMGRKGSDAIHPIVFLEGYSDNYFIGAMITHSGKFEDNILLKLSYFKEYDEDNKKYEVIFDGTYLVEVKLLKRLDWSPFRKVGMLTKEGVAFVELKLIGKNPLVWEEYRQNI